jgi:hypothetical protein
MSISVSSPAAPPIIGALADFASHRIEGFATLGGQFSVPLFSQVLDNLWMGGCPVEAAPKEFAYVVSLYPWGIYHVHAHQVYLECTLFDSVEQPLDSDRLHALARAVTDFARLGPTLVHCQAGLNRSGLITALALMHQGWRAESAIAHLREKRCSEVLCNAHFRAWLLREDALAHGEEPPQRPFTGRAGWERS